MSERTTGEKLPGEARFIDVSDYARPLGVWVARRLQKTPVTAPWVTLAFGVIGVAGALAYGTGGTLPALAGAAALQAKNVLDAADGSLARLQRRPSRIGRFLDSIMDAVVAAALCAASGHVVGRVRPGAYAFVLAGAALLFGLLQGSIFNYYYVRYRLRRGGDVTSRLHEELGEGEAQEYRGQPAALTLLRSLLAIYRVIYAWQDRVVQRLDLWAMAPLVAGERWEAADALRDAPRFMTAVSLLGPGFQILVLDVLTVLGARAPALALEAFLWAVALAGTLYGAALFGYLRRRANRLATI